MRDDKDVEVISFGCRLNSYEGEIMRHLARESGLDDCIFINSCAVTHEAQRQARQKIRSLKRRYPEKRIIVTGCAAQIDPDHFKNMDAVDGVIGNREKLDPSIMRRLAVSRDRSGHVSGNGSGDGSGHISGDVSGHISGDGSGHISGDGSGHVSGNGSGHGEGDGFDDNPDMSVDSLARGMGVRDGTAKKPVAATVVTAGATTAGNAKPVMVGDINRDMPTGIIPDGVFPERVRAMVEIQHGCDHACTFCIIPQGRGANRSRRVEDIIASAAKMMEKGKKEIVLTGVDITDWGQDIKGRPRLGNLVSALLDALPQLSRLRLSSLDPAEIDPLLLTLLCEEDRLLPHIHLSVQSGDDMILKRMKRRHRRHHVLDLCRHIRRHRPSVTFGADFITGFPTESEDMFMSSMTLLDQCRMIFAHVFPFSLRPGTPAARMPQLPPGIARKRAWKMRRAASALQLDDHQATIGSIVSVLSERPHDGRCRHYRKVRWDGRRRPGDIFDARVEGVAGDGRLEVTPLPVHRPAGKNPQARAS